jgi:hypothetical protein
MPNIIKQDQVAERNIVLGQFADGTIHVVEMIEMVMRTIESSDLREYFLTRPVEFAEKTGLEPLGTEESRKKEMQDFAVRLHNLTAGLLSETFDGFVPSITSTADGFVILIEQDVNDPIHRNDPMHLGTVTRVFDIDGQCVHGEHELK